jgi:hypothetical protein
MGGTVLQIGVFPIAFRQVVPLQVVVLLVHTNLKIGEGISIIVAS